MYDVTRQFITEPFTIHRRSDLWIRHEFDLDGSEASIAKHYLRVEKFDGIVSLINPAKYSYSDGDFEMRQLVNEEDQTYWALNSDSHGWVKIELKDSHNKHRIYEVVFDYVMKGPGHMQSWLNDKVVLNQGGPAQWRSTRRHLALDKILVKTRYLNVGVADPKPSCEIDNFCVYYYEKIECDFRNYKPAMTLSIPTQIESIRGYATAQTSKYLGTTISTTLTFYSEVEHTDFLLHIDRPHVLIDDKGTYYVGVVELGECRYIGIDLYEQDIVFKSPCRLGEGWI